MRQARTQAMRQKAIVQFVVSAIAALGAGSATASGFQLLEQNASGLGNAYAGSAAVAENASTIFFNPAGMTRLGTNEVSLGVTPVRTSFKFRNQGSSAGVLGTSGDGGDAGGTAFVPNAYYSRGITKDVFVGIGVSVPFGLKTEYDEPWVGGAQAQLFDVRTININPSIAFRVNEKLSVVLGVNYMHMDAEYQRQAAVSSGATSTTKIALKADGNAVGWNAGLLFNPSESMRLGLSYRGEVEQKLRGTLAISGALAGANAALTTGDAKADLTLPDTFIFSVVQDLTSSWQMLGDISLTRWSSIKDVNIVRTSGPLSGATVQTLEADFRDTWRVALGATNRLNDSWKLKFGVAYDQSPVRDEGTRLVSLPDNDRVWLSLGTQWAPTKTSAVDIGASYLIVGDSDIDNNQTSAGRGRVTGSYKGRVIILGAQYSMSF